MEETIQCRPGCGACCIHISISSAIPGHPNGKPSGVSCVNLNPITRMCELWNTSDFPDLCKRFQAVFWMCGTNFDEAVSKIKRLEKETGSEKSA